MKSIKDRSDIKSNSSLNSMLGQSLWYARCCILSVSLMSGFGIPWNYDQARVKAWLEDEHIEADKIPQNMTILRAVYKKGSPHYLYEYNGDDKDYRNFLWDDATFKKVITPISQAYLIMDEVQLAKYFFNCSKDQQKNDGKMNTALLLIKSAQIQSQFMSDNLRNSDGLFVSKTDITPNPFGDAILEEDDDDNLPEVSDQALPMKAFSMLSHALNDSRYTPFFDEDESLQNKKFAEEIYEVFKDSPEDIFEGKTRDLCNVISACIEYYRVCPSQDVLDYITKLALELESRIDMSGNLFRFPFDSKLVSNATCFSAIKTFIEAYRITGIQKFESAANTLYKKLDILWNPIDCIYALDEDKKYKYTARDVGSVLSGLNSIRLFGRDYAKEAESKLISFFNSAVNTSKLIQSTLPPPDKDDSESKYASLMFRLETPLYTDFCSADIPQSLEAKTAPVFAKKFTFKPNKHAYDINSNAFYSEYSLYTAYEMLNLNYPMIECFYDRASIENQLLYKDSGGQTQYQNAIS